jgi:hypothetical protein
MFRLKGTNMKQLIPGAVCLLLGVMAAAGAGTDAGATNSPVPQKRPAKTARVIHHSPKRQPVDRPAATGVAAANAAKAKKNGTGQIVYSDALRRYRHERHSRDWWKRSYAVIVFASGGYYYWDAGYWFPAWGYDPTYDYYDYDGPIYTYGNLLPDQVILNVQRALQELGYYPGGLTGSLGLSSRQALANYQQDAGLAITGAIDAPTVESLGLE